MGLRCSIALKMRILNVKSHHISLLLILTPRDVLHLSGVAAMLVSSWLEVFRCRLRSLVRPKDPQRRRNDRIEPLEVRSMMTVQAVDDIITAELQPGIPIVLDVLANDSGSTPLHLVSISMSTAGVTSIVAGNPMGTGPESRDRISYTPGANFFGSDLLTYTVADLSGSQSTASVSLIQAAGGGAGTPPGGAGTPPGGTGTPPGWRRRRGTRSGAVDQQHASGQ